MGFPETDWLRSDAYADIKQEEDERAYTNAKCKDPHPNGSNCRPSWDGYGYVCINRILREKDSES